MQSSMIEMMESSSSSGKMSPAYCPTRATPSVVSWADLSGQMIPYTRQTAQFGLVLAWCPGQGHGLHGGFSMLNSSEWPNAADVCLLSSILEVQSIPRRFYLSAKACAGILRRAARREKVLPPELGEALKAVATSTPQSRDA